MLELLIAASCIFGNTQSCGSSIQAYSKYTGIDKKVEEIGERYIVLSISVGVINAVKDQKIMVPILVSPKGYVLSSEVGSNMMYLRYNIGY